MNLRQPKQETMVEKQGEEENVLGRGERERVEEGEERFLICEREI